MKKIILITFSLLTLTGTTIRAQEVIPAEKYGRTLNGGLGIGYYGYVGHLMPVIHANYEFDVAKNLTFAPFITYYSYQSNYYWGRDYSYRQTVIPVGVKATYYFDKLLKAGTNWDFYLAGSIGVAIRKTTWESGYYGETSVRHGSSGLYLDGHIGSEYHLNNNFGLFLDLSTGISTFGLAIHL
jgi:hypothetical protein